MKIATYKRKEEDPKKGYDVIFDLTSKRYSDFFCARMYEKDILNMRDKLEEIIMDINNNKIKLIEENNES